MDQHVISGKAAPVRFNGVSKVYGDDVIAVDDIDLEIEAGKLVDHCWDHPDAARPQRFG